MTNTDFEKAISDYRDNKITESELSEKFFWIAENSINYFVNKLPDKNDTIQECVLICWEKLPKYNQTKGKAFNFFTTITISLLRQIYRKEKNYKILKEKYKKFKY